MNTFQGCHYCELSKFGIFETNRVVHSREVFVLFNIGIETQFFIFKTVLRIFKVDSPNEQVIYLLSSLRLLACRLLARRGLHLILSGSFQVVPS